MTGDKTNHYEVLGVQPDASPVDVKKAARKLMQQHHPDLGGDATEASKINDAYEVLGNETSRQEYDAFLRGESEEEPLPDPESYIDEWGTEETWEDPDDPDVPDVPDVPEDDEVLDVEVDEQDPSPPAEPQPASPPADATPPSPPAPTKVHTALGRASLFGLLPALVCMVFVLGQSWLLNDQTPAAFLGPGFGAAIGFLAPVVLRKRLAKHKDSRRIISASLASVFAVVALAFVAHDNPLFIAALQSLIAVGVGMALFMAGWARHRIAQRIIAPKGLKPDGTIFGESSGDAAGELLNATIWGCLQSPELHAARGFQTSDRDNPFTKAILLGNRIALIRPMLVPSQMEDPYLYWSPPTLFMSGSNAPYPEAVITMDLKAYRASLHRTMPGAQVQEFLVIYPASAPIAPPASPTTGVPLVVRHEDAEAALKDFLVPERPVSHVDHLRAAETILGLEYNLMNS